MSKKRKLKTARSLTLREESLAENKVLGLDQQQQQMDFIFSVLHEHGINSRLWMEEYLRACQSNGFQAPPDFEKFLPWNLSPEVRERLSRDSFFSYGNAKFIQKNDGTVYHLHPDGTHVKVNIGDMTAAEFDSLTGAV
jgi:hypothetical protein